MWYVYMLHCADDTFYTGITTDLNRRLQEHNNSTLGAKYTRGRTPVTMIYNAEYETRNLASKEEYRIKKLTKKEKLKTISKKQIN